MINSLDNPIQCKDNDVRYDLHPRLYYPNNNNAHSITFPDGTSIPVYYNIVITCIAVHLPTKYEVEYCEQVSLTSKFDWYPYGKGGSFSKLEAHSNYIYLVLE